MARATSLIAVVGITVGVAALIVALALANGFRDEMRDKILRGTAHLTVMRSDGEPISDYQGDCRANRRRSWGGVGDGNHLRRGRHRRQARFGLCGPAWSRCRLGTSNDRDFPHPLWPVQLSTFLK
jgi:hypothetical protein